jgi:hypothetical protein
MKNKKTPITFDEAVKHYPKLNDEFIEQVWKEESQKWLDEYNEEIPEEEYVWTYYYLTEALAAHVNGDPGAIKAFGSLNSLL